MNLHRHLRRRGHEARLLVGYRHTDGPGVEAMLHERAAGAWRGAWWSLYRRLQPWYRRSRVARHGCRLAHRLAAPQGARSRAAGREDFDFPGARTLLDDWPDVFHLHNLHGGYFDLRVLPRLREVAPVIVTLHDAWLMSGHCAHSMGCERWLTGCGECPDLTLYPAVKRDATRENWQRKRGILRDCRLHVATPSQWLMDKLQASIVREGVVESRVIANGVDCDVFQPASCKVTVRKALGIDPGARVVLLAAAGGAENPWKDFATVRAAMERLAGRAQWAGRVLAVSLGGGNREERIGRISLRHVPFIGDERQVAKYYQCADVYVHAAREDTFPTSVLEALACGAPVVATAVGGIREQVRCISAVGEAQATGVLVPARDAAALARAIDGVLGNGALRRRLSANAVADAGARFTVDNQIDAYEGWYETIVERAAARRGGRCGAGRSTLAVPLASQA